MRATASGGRLAFTLLTPHEMRVLATLCLRHARLPYASPQHASTLLVSACTLGSLPSVPTTNTHSQLGAQGGGIAGVEAPPP
jgi:hypothetical protein